MFTAVRTDRFFVNLAQEENAVCSVESMFLLTVGKICIK